MKKVYFTATQSGENDPVFADLQGSLGFKLGMIRADDGSFGFCSLDENDELTSGMFPANTKCFLQPRQENRKLIPDDGGARPDYINFFSFDFNDSPIDGFIMDGFIIMPDETEYTPHELSILSHCKSLLFNSNSDKLIDLANTL
jgi:hypothetical protein